VLERIESTLTVLVSLIGAMSAVLSLMAQAKRLLAQVSSERIVADLEQDIVRLDAEVRNQQAEIVQLKQQQQPP
jgi:hypothetical protein